jgi:hypothetical protein
MAVDESSFKTSFRKSLKEHFGSEVMVWTNNDMFRIGLPDFSATFRGSFFAVEAKFIKELPKRGSSKVLTHEVSEAQLSFLRGIRETGCFSAVLIGLKDVAVVMLDLKSNYTRDEILAAPRIGRDRGQWQVQWFFSSILGEPFNG